MENFFGILMSLTMLSLFLYFGYKDDYKRNPKEFIKTIIGVPIAIGASIFGMRGIPRLIKEWLQEDEEKK
jgi:hypothetical protein